MAPTADGSVMAAEAPARPLLRQTAINIDAVRQFPGQLQVDRRVLVDIPGKFFPSLQPSTRSCAHQISRLSTGTTKSTMLHCMPCSLNRRRQLPMFRARELWPLPPLERQRQLPAQAPSQRRLALAVRWSKVRRLWPPPTRLSEKGENEPGV